MRHELSAGAFVYKIERGRALFLVMLHDDRKSWDLPKGHVEKGESMEQAARREIKEEAGIAAEFLPSFREQINYIFSERGGRIYKTVLYFISKVGTDTRIRVSEEHDAYKWLTYDDALKTTTYRTMKQLLPKVDDYISRYERMEALNKEYAALPKRHPRGWDLSKTLVPGEGLLNATLMFIGQAPGRNEDRLRRPFIGRAGQLLDKALEHARINRKKTYVTSVCQFFPPENRLPTDEEISLCKPFLLRQIDIIKPKYIVLLGNVASKCMLGNGEVGKSHGKFIKKGSIVYMPTFHPAAALRFKRIDALLIGDIKSLSQRIKQEKLPENK